MLEKFEEEKRRRNELIFVCALVQIISIGGNHWVAYVYICCVAS